MPLLTVIGLTCIIAMFASFILGLGGVSLWMAMADRADARRGRRMPIEQPVEYRQAA